MSDPPVSEQVFERSNHHHGASSSAALRRRAQAIRTATKYRVRHAARRLGWEIRRIDPDAYLGIFATRVIADFGLNCVVDVGANVGQFGQMLRAEGYQGELVSFEPVAEVYDELAAATARDGRWRAVHLALGAQNAEMQINVMRSSNMSSLLDPSVEAIDRWSFVEPVERSEAVQVARLDDVLGDHAPSLDPLRVYLKVDTQGTDLDVIEGAKGVLGCVGAIQTELSFKPLYRRQVSYTETLDYLRSLDYQVAGVFPIVHDDNTAIIEADCVLVHRDLRRLG